ncbi:MAG: hypothetical protein OJF60_001729 [Burkholderiaceae bacterium]|jgi:hypothetical protein|nr:MAG: hypothetical protein OJF60_001729 [Burkholderiaceae bacterium]
MRRDKLKTPIALVAAAIAASSFIVTPAAAAPPADTARKVDRLQDEINAMAQQLQEMKQQLLQMKQENQQLRGQQAETAKQTEQAVTQQKELQTQVTAATQTAQSAQSAATKPSPLDNVSLWGYGELYYTHPTNKQPDTRADLARAVFGIGYQFNDTTRFNSEYEIEHAVASADDVGESEVEQFYVDHRLNPSLSARAGLFLIPAGLLNENHEPTNFYGVTRNFVETLIIPSTWREGGVSLYGETENGLGWNAGLTTGLDLSKWDFNPETPLYTSALELQNNGAAPMQATHQEMALANAQKLSGYLALNYRGVPGLTVGGTVFGGGAVSATPYTGSQNAYLYEGHVRYQPGRWDLSALYARGGFTNTAQANAQFPGASNPLPASFYGWYAQAAYNFDVGGYRLAPFARYEKYDMGASYEGLAPGFSGTLTGTTPAGTFPSPRDTVYTLGANFYLNPNVVFKFDVQRFRTNIDFDRIDLGLGLAF